MGAAAQLPVQQGFLYNLPSTTQNSTCLRWKSHHTISTAKPNFTPIPFPTSPNFQNHPPCTQPCFFLKYIAIALPALIPSMAQ